VASWYEVYGLRFGQKKLRLRSYDFGSPMTDDVLVNRWPHTARRAVLVIHSNVESASSLLKDFFVSRF
jgi:hypothetical protein